MESGSFERVLIDGTILSLLLGAVILGSLRYNPRLWLQDYPKAIREKVPALSASERRDRGVVSILVIGILLGGVLLEALHLRTYQWGMSQFGIAYLHVFLMLAIFNVFDALVLDLFILTLLRPKFAFVPGIEGMEHLLFDTRKQFFDFLKGFVFCAAASLPFALIAVI
jgi:hypothetical protein